MSEVRRAIEELARQGLDAHAFVERATPYIRQQVPFDVCSWLSYDPDVVLPTSGYDCGESKPSDLRLQYCANEQLQDDVHKFRDLALQAVPVGVQDRVSRGRQRTSHRFRELLEPRGMYAELRAALVVDSGCWGSLTLERSRGGLPFSSTETSVVAGVASALASGLARASFAHQSTADVPEVPGVLIVDGYGGIVSASETAAGWLDVLRSPSIGLTPAVPLPIIAVAARTRAVGPTRLRVRTGHGHWVTLHGALQHTQLQTRSHGRDDDRVFVTIERSRSSEVLPLAARRYGLTPRELTLLGLMLRGLSTRRIAERLRISEYTVQDHLKSIFEKTGVRGRRELAHQLAVGLFGSSLSKLPQRE